MKIRELRNKVKAAHKKALRLQSDLKDSNNPQTVAVYHNACGQEQATFAILQAINGNPMYLDILIDPS